MISSWRHPARAFMTGFWPGARKRDAGAWRISRWHIFLRLTVCLKCAALPGIHIDTEGRDVEELVPIVMDEITAKR